MEQSGPVSFIDDMEYHKFSDFLGINREDRKSSKVANKLSYLWDWGKTLTGSDKRVDIAIAIKNLVKKLGYNSVGNDLVGKLYLYTKLDTQKQSVEQDKLNLEKEMEAVSVT